MFSEENFHFLCQILEQKSSETLSMWENREEKFYAQYFRSIAAPYEHLNSFRGGGELKEEKNNLNRTKNKKLINCGFERVETIFPKLLLCSSRSSSPRSIHGPWSSAALERGTKRTNESGSQSSEFNVLDTVSRTTS